MLVGVLHIDLISAPGGHSWLHCWSDVRGGGTGGRGRGSSTSSGTELTVRFWRNSPSRKTRTPWVGLTSPWWPGSRTQATDTSPKRPLFLVTVNEAAQRNTTRHHVTKLRHVITSWACEVITEFIQLYGLQGRECSSSVLKCVPQIVSNMLTT